MLLLKFFKRKVSCSFIVTHIVVPCLRKLQELGFLRRFNVLQLLFLSGPYIILLSHRLFSEELIELASRLLSFLIVTFDLTLLSIFFQKSQEIKHFVISRDVDNTALGSLLLDEFGPVQVVWVVLR